MEQHRITLGIYGGPGDEQNGVFDVKPRGLHIIISNSEGWEHASVSRRSKMPAADHVNIHNYCLHLWRPTQQSIPVPPSIMVGPK